MKKSIFTICCTLLCSVSLFAAAPDTLNVDKSVQGRLVGVDMIMPIKIDSSVLPSFIAATNTFWDLTHVTYGTPVRAVRYQGLSPYHYYDSVGYSFDSLHYSAKIASLYITDGVEQKLQDIDTQTVFVTKPSGDRDTIAFGFPRIVYSGLGYLKTPYPLTYTTPHTTWGSDFTYKTPFTVTDRALGITRKNAIIYSHFVESNEVVGWGSMRVSTLDSDATTHTASLSDSIKVLQVKTIATSYDSITLPNVALFDSLGFDSVYTRSTYTVNFYRSGALNPLVTVTYSSAAFDSVIAVNVNFDGKRPTSVSSVPAGLANVAVYPNPVTNGSMYVEVPNAGNGSWSYQLVNVAGQQITANTLQLGNGTNRAQISFGTNVAPGVYYLRLMNNNQLSGVQAVVVQ